MPDANARERKSRIGTIGSRARSSQATKATASRSPAASAATTSRLLQPALFPRMSPQTTPSAAPVTSARPRNVESGARSEAFADAAQHERDDDAGRSAR